MPDDFIPDDLVPEPAPFDQEALLAKAQAAGLDTSSYNSPEALVDGLLGQLNDQRNQMMTYMASQQPQVPDPEPTPDPQDEWNIDNHFESRWNIPKQDDSWGPWLQMNLEQGTVTKSQDGRYVPTPGNEYLTAAPQLQGINSFEAAQQGTVRGLFNEGNFYRKVWDAFEEPISRMTEEKARQLIESAFGEESRNNAIGNFEREHQSALYSDVDQKTPTEYGQQFFRTIEEIQNAGSDPEALLKLAARVSPPPAAAPATTAQPADSADLQQQQSFLDDSFAAASHTPSSQQTGETPGQPGPMTDTELRNLFVTRHQANQS